MILSADRYTEMLLEISDLKRKLDESQELVAVIRNTESSEIAALKIKLDESDARVAAAFRVAAEICRAKAVYANRSAHGKDEFSAGLLHELENIMYDTAKNIEAAIPADADLQLRIDVAEAVLAEQQFWIDEFCELNGGELTEETRTHVIDSRDTLIALQRERDGNETLLK